MRSSRNKKSKSQLRDYLQAGRKRKAPYRELYHSLNIYAPYPNGGFAECGGAVGEMKSDALTYSYTGQNFTFDAVEQYRFGYHTFTAGAIYRPSSGSTTDGFSFETDKYGYASGYYLDARGYPYNFQCHANNYSDIVAQATSKYKQNIAKYGYGDNSGLDLSSKPNHLEHDYIQQCTDIDLQTYRTNRVNGEKLSLVGGMLDPLVSGCFYGPNSLRNNSALLSCTMAVGNSNTSCDNVLPCNMFHNCNSLCSGYQSDYPSVVDRYVQTTAGERDSKKSTSNMNGSQLENDNSVSNLLNGHRTVICHSSPAKSVAEREIFPDQYAVNIANEPTTSMTPSTPWSSYNKNEMTARDASLEQAPTSFSLSHDCRGQDKEAIVAQVQPTSNSSIGMATSVIQMTTRNRYRLSTVFDLT